jgi:hypothetical protein
MLSAAWSAPFSFCQVGQIPNSYFEQQRNNAMTAVNASPYPNRSPEQRRRVAYKAPCPTKPHHAEAPTPIDTDELIDVDTDWLLESDDETPSNHGQQDYSRPFKQGNFDHFCGIYAILNGLKIANEKSGIHADVAWAGVFAAVISKIDSLSSLKDVVLQGLSDSQFEGCLRVAINYLAKQHQIKVTYDWPWIDQRLLSRRKLVAAIKSAVETPDTVAMLRYRNSVANHWSVVEAISRDIVSFADSTWVSRIPIAQLGFRKFAKNDSDVVNTIDRKSLLLIHVMPSPTD